MSSSVRDRLIHSRPGVRAALVAGLSESSLVTAAQAAAALNDALPPELLQALRDLLPSLLHEARLTDGGLFGVRRRLVRILSNRLRIERDLRTHPEVLSVSIVRPIIILGPPRTGTTLLHRLLALDPAARAPALWELECPSPPPELATYDRDPRIAAAQRYLEEAYQAAPALRELHPIASTEPDECSWLMLSSLRTRQLLFEYDLPSYAQTLTHANLLVTYRLHRRQLQLLTWRCPAQRLVLKHPSHLWFLEALFTVYPDALIIQTHRDPVRVLPSAVRLSATLRAVSSDAVNPTSIAENGLRELPLALERAATVRDARPGSFCDVHYGDLVRDPVSEARRIYRCFSLPWSDELEARMRRWLEQTGHAQREPGRYQPLAELGLTTEAVRAAFASYTQRFDVASE
jgi:hypothetical protein